jgi:hypothetical protein
VYKQNSLFPANHEFVTKLKEAVDTEEEKMKKMKLSPKQTLCLQWYSAWKERNSASYLGTKILKLISASVYSYVRNELVFTGNEIALRVEDIKREANTNKREVYDLLKDFFSTNEMKNDSQITMSLSKPHNKKALIFFKNIIVECLENEPTEEKNNKAFVQCWKIANSLPDEINNSLEIIHGLMSACNEYSLVWLSYNLSVDLENLGFDLKSSNQQIIKLNILILSRLFENNTEDRLNQFLKHINSVIPEKDRSYYREVWIRRVLIDSEMTFQKHIDLLNIVTDQIGYFDFFFEVHSTKLNLVLLGSPRQERVDYIAGNIETVISKGHTLSSNHLNLLLQTIYQESLMDFNEFSSFLRKYPNCLNRVLDIYKVHCNSREKTLDSIFVQLQSGSADSSRIIRAIRLFATLDTLRPEFEKYIGIKEQLNNLYPDLIDFKVPLNQAAKLLISISEKGSDFEVNDGKVERTADIIAQIISDSIYTESISAKKKGICTTLKKMGTTLSEARIRALGLSKLIANFKKIASVNPPLFVTNFEGFEKAISALESTSSSSNLDELLSSLQNLAGKNDQEFDIFKKEYEKNEIVKLHFLYLCNKLRFTNSRDIDKEIAKLESSNSIDHLEQLVSYAGSRGHQEWQYVLKAFFEPRQAAKSSLSSKTWPGSATLH